MELQSARTSAPTAGTRAFDPLAMSGKIAAPLLTFEAMLPWVSITPLGLPVVPDV